MADNLFNVVVEDRPPSQVRQGERVPFADQYPAIGNHVGVAYIEAEPGNAAEILALLIEIDALAVNYALETGTATAEDGKRPRVEIRVYGRTNAPLEQ